jgi:hypothetical protein
MSRHVTVLGVAIIALTLARTEAVRGNGQDFFPAAEGKSSDLVYFGRIKDKSTGRLIRDRAFFTIFDSATGMNFPFMNDSPAQYRSPDVGAAIKELGGTKADPKNLEIQLMVAGYKNARLTTLPRTSRGAVELNFVMEPATSGQAPPSAGGESPGMFGLGWTRILAVGAVALLIAAVMARTLVLRSSTAD